MNAQRSLFDFAEIARERVGVPYQPSSATSKAAAELMEPHANRMEARVLDIIRAAGDNGATAAEIMRAMHTTNPNHVRPRCTGLRKKGLIITNGRERKSLDSEANETVWLST